MLDRLLATWPGILAVIAATTVAGTLLGALIVLLTGGMS